MKNKIFSRPHLIKSIGVSVFLAALAGFTSVAQARKMNPEPSVPVRAYYPQLDSCAKFDILDKRAQSTKDYYFDNQRWIEGTPNKEYTIRVSNRCDFRVLAVVSVDGLNVLNGKKANYEQGGYILAPRSTVDLKGWRTSDNTEAVFYFSSPEKSYGGRVGKAENLGVIGVAFFREKEDYIPPDSIAQAPTAIPAPPPEGSLAPAPSLSKQRAQDASASTGMVQEKAEQSLGTGYGRNIHSPVVKQEFERDSAEPFRVSVLRYETVDVLIAKGIIPQPTRPKTNMGPEAFPAQNEYVPAPPPFSQSRNK